MSRTPIKPTIIWEGSVKLDDEVFKGRVVVVSHPKASEYRSTINYKLVCEHSNENDATGVPRWTMTPQMFPEFLDVVADKFLKEKGDQP